MVTREYECSKDGYFAVKRNVSDPVIKELCPICSRPGEQVFTRFPTWGFTGADGGIPNKTADWSEYTGWQRDRIASFTDKLHHDNIGKSDPSIKRVTKKTVSGKNR